MVQMVLSDLEIGVERELPITYSFVRNTLERSMCGERQTLDCCLPVAADFTAMTGRELAFRIYSEFPKDPEAYKHISRLQLIFRNVVPELGSTQSVNVPQMKEEFKEYMTPAKEKLMLPIIFLHTHPSNLSIPSKGDLLSAQHQHDSTVRLGNTRFWDWAVLRVVNPEINVNNGCLGCCTFDGNLSIDNQFFYQFTGDNDALKRFMDKYDITLCLQQAEFYLQSTDKVAQTFARALEESGAFKTLYFPSGTLCERVGENKRWTIKKENIRKIAEKFQYVIKVKKTRVTKKVFYLLSL